jgi:CTP-dependent riboflavin kinase
MRVLRGVVKAGLCDAKNWDVKAIRTVTGRPDLVEGTLNVKLNEPHVLRPDFALPAASRNDRNEDLYLEECLLLINSDKVPALIARTSTNFWGRETLEIMASVHLRHTYRLNDEDIIRVQVRTESTETLT